MVFKTYGEVTDVHVISGDSASGNVLVDGGHKVLSLSTKIHSRRPLQNVQPVSLTTHTSNMNFFQFSANSLLHTVSIYECKITQETKVLPVKLPNAS